MIKLTATERGLDDFGSGAYGATRGSRIHNGVDFIAQPRSYVHPVTSGEVTKIGYPYGDNLNYRYVQVTDAEGNDWRYFYVKPLVVAGDNVTPESWLGTVQDLDSRYKGITPHVHLEIKDKDGEFINPASLGAV